MCQCNKREASGRDRIDRKKKWGALNVITAVVFFLFPKCPICWAAYASFFSFIGLENVAYNSNWRIVILAIFLIGSVFLIYKHYQNKSWLNIVIYTSGLAILIVTFYMDFNEMWWLYIVAFLMLLSNFEFRKKQESAVLIK